MGLLGNLFEKKYCDICGQEIKFLGNKKLEDGNMCKDCEKKLSPWFDDRRHTTVEEIKKQLQYREENRAQLPSFVPDEVYGESYAKLYVDNKNRKFTVTSAKPNEFNEKNPDLLSFDDVLSCEHKVSESKREKKRTVDGKSVSYDPPRYEYSYSFNIALNVRHPYFDDMSFNVCSSVDTGERQMGENVKPTPRMRLQDVEGVKEYNEMLSLGDYIKAVVDSWKTGEKPVRRTSEVEETTDPRIERINAFETKRKEREALIAQATENLNNKGVITKIAESAGITYEQAIAYRDTYAKHLNDNITKVATEGPEAVAKLTIEAEEMAREAAAVSVADIKEYLRLTNEAIEKEADRLQEMGWKPEETA
jgi:hypothetical protein